jgi:hypothetical protein
MFSDKRKELNNNNIEYVFQMAYDDTSSLFSA